MHEGRLARQEVGGEGTDLLHAVPQRRELDREDRQPVVEVAPEGPARHQVLQVAVGGRHHPDVDLHRPGSADPLEHPLLEHAQEPDLHCG